MSFFQPSFKLRDKNRVGAKVTRWYYPPETPCERLLAHSEVSEEIKTNLRATRANLDPVQLIKALREAQAELTRLAGRGDVTEPSPAETSLERFLAQLPELWRMGESRPTHRQRPKQVRTWRTRADPFEACGPTFAGGSSKNRTSPARRRSTDFDSGTRVSLPQANCGPFSGACRVAASYGPTAAGDLEPGTPKRCPTEQPSECRRTGVVAVRLMERRAGRPLHLMRPMPSLCNRIGPLADELLRSRISGKGAVLWLWNPEESATTTSTLR